MRRRVRPTWRLGLIIAVLVVGVAVRPTSGQALGRAGLVASTTPAPGYLLASSTGAVYGFNTVTYGSTYTDGLTGLSGSHPLNAPIVGIIPTPNGGGYWLIAKDGGVFDFGDAAFYGSTYTYGITGLSGSHPLNAPIVGGAAAPDGQGYWLVGADGGVFDFGDAAFYGSTYTYGITGLSGPHPLDAPIVGMAADPAGGGYWLVGSDGSVYAFGDAPLLGSVPGITTPSQQLENVAPDPNFTSDSGPCQQGTVNNTSCLLESVRAIDYGRELEGLLPMVLPSNFLSLSPPEQLLVLVDEERVSRGLQPVYGIVPALNSIAESGAADNTDPVAPPGFFSQGPWVVETGSNWADDFSTASSVFDWMYDDGLYPQSLDFNLACTPQSTSGCWGHRDNILLPDESGDTLVMGAAFVPESTITGSSFFAPVGSFTTISTYVPTSELSSVSFSYTWSEAVADGANPLP
jgi:hypothetical protein